MKKKARTPISDRAPKKSKEPADIANPTRTSRTEHWEENTRCARRPAPVARQVFWLAKGPKGDLADLRWQRHNFSVFFTSKTVCNKSNRYSKVVQQPFPNEYYNIQSAKAVSAVFGI